METPLSVSDYNQSGTSLSQFPHWEPGDPKVLGRLKVLTQLEIFLGPWESMFVTDYVNSMKSKSVILLTLKFRYYSANVMNLVVLGKGTKAVECNNDF